jgi:hypothetical protein
VLTAARHHRTRNNDQEDDMSARTRNAPPEAIVARRTIATEPDYPDAERAVDWLADQGFPVERVAIVGSGLHSVEQVFGRTTTGRAALMGAMQGAWIGLFFALFLGLFFTNVGSYLALLLYGLVAGAIWGSLWRGLFQYAQRGRRDFASVTETRADRYEVQVDDGVAVRAERLLAEMPRLVPVSGAATATQPADRPLTQRSQP